MREYLYHHTPLGQAGLPALAQLLHAQPGSRLYEQAQMLLGAYQHSEGWGFALREVPLSSGPDGLISAGDVSIRSHIAADLLRGEPTAFAYIVTCGPSIAAPSAAAANAWESFMLDRLAHLAFLQARQALLTYARQELGLEHCALLAPGSITDWDAAELNRLFSLLPDLDQQLGVRLLPSGFIQPLQSVCGLLARAEQDFCSCQLCSRPDCPSREESFDQEQRCHSAEG